ncbi:MAG: hypothetical protein RIT27_658 [Pseudomonadota bacterium]|jgi:uncharacterized protein (DUF58 family)
MSSNFNARLPKQAVSRCRLCRQNIYILPTQHGLMLGLIIVTVVLGSMQYSNSMGFLLAFLLVALSFVGLFYTYHNLVGLTISASAGQAVFAGERGIIPLWFDNHGQAARWAIHAQIFQNEPPRPRFRDLFDLGKNPPSIATFDIIEDQLQRIDLPVLTNKRGILKLSRITLSTTFPLGLFRAWTYLALSDAQLMVYPRPLNVLPFPQGVSSEGRSASLHGDGEDFSGFRAYVIGDSPRHIDWKAAARERGFLIKQFSGNEGAQQYIFTLQDVTSLNDLDSGLSQLCDWIVQAHHQGLHYGLELPALSYPISNEETHFQHCLSALATFENISP